MTGRSLAAARFLPPEGDGAVRALLTCDCGTATDLTVVLEGHGSAEAAFTCGGCRTSHWFTVTANGAP